jgi:hypothetical protein
VTDVGKSERRHTIRMLPAGVPAMICFMPEKGAGGVGAHPHAKNACRVAAKQKRPALSRRLFAACRAFAGYERFSL